MVQQYTSLDVHTYVLLQACWTLSSSFTNYKTEAAYHTHTSIHHDRAVWYMAAHALLKASFPSSWLWLSTEFDSAAVNKSSLYSVDCDASHIVFLAY